MKFYLLLVSVVLLTACSKPKDWTCTCDYDSLSGNGTATKSIMDKKQVDANTECTDYGKTLIGGNGTYTCKIAAQ